LNVQPESHEPNSKEARRAVNAGVDVLVAQGSDCGGHGAANSASIISLVPEIVSTFPQIPVLAAGGIVDASGILAALVLGAEGVVMGTRFATTPESAMADNAKALILRTTDGGATTKRFYPT
jgi:nitronate monooxygenase